MSRVTSESLNAPLIAAARENAGKVGAEGAAVNAASRIARSCVRPFPTDAANDAHVERTIAHKLDLDRRIAGIVAKREGLTDVEADAYLSAMHDAPAVMSSGRYSFGVDTHAIGMAAVDGLRSVLA